MKNKYIYLITYTIAFLFATTTTLARATYHIDKNAIVENEWALPFSGNLITHSNYDYNSDIYFNNHGFRHGGVDIHQGARKVVLAIDDGEVIHVVKDDHKTFNSSRIYIKHTSEAGTFIATYGHTYPKDGIKNGVIVAKGSEIGYIKTFGSPDHLHLEIRNSGSDDTIYHEKFGGIKGKIIDPIKYLKNNKNDSITENINSKNCGVFNDLKENDEYCDAVRFLKGKKIVEGYNTSPPTIGTENPILREEAAKIIALIHATTNNETIRIDDADQLWSLKYQRYVIEQEIMTGYKNGDFGGKELITYQETAKILFTGIFGHLFDKNEDDYWHENNTLNTAVDLGTYICWANRLNLFGSVKNYKINTPINRGNVFVAAYNAWGKITEKGFNAAKSEAETTCEVVK